MVEKDNVDLVVAAAGCVATTKEKWPRDWQYRGEDVAKEWCSSYDAAAAAAGGCAVGDDVRNNPCPAIVAEAREYPRYSCCPARVDNHVLFGTRMGVSHPRPLEP